MRHPVLLALGAGLVSSTGFAPWNLWPATLAAFALLILVVQQAPTLRAALNRGYWFGVGHFTVGLNWIAHAFSFQDKMPAEFGYGAVVALSLYIAVYPMLAAGLAWRWGRHDRATFVLLFAAAWIVTEWLRATLFTGFAWNPLGVVALPMLGLAQVSAWIGTYGLSGVIIAAAGAIVIAAQRRWRPAAAIAAPILATAVIGALVTGNAGTGALIRVIQPNIGQIEKHDPDRRFENIRLLTEMTGPPAAEPRLVFWPEAAIDNEFRLTEQRDLREAVTANLGAGDWLMTGGIAFVYGIEDGEPAVIAARNSLFVLGADGRVAGRYDKAHLVPYGEYLPMRPILSAIGLSRLVPGDLDFWSGPGPLSFALPGFGRMGVQICYEIIFSGQVVDAANRPDFLFNPSNDAWFGRWGPPQHLAQARMRAIEEGLPVIRSTPTGISAVVDADGRLIASVPHERRGIIDARLPRPHPPTAFARLGNILPFALAFALAALAVVIRRRAR